MNVYKNVVKITYVHVKNTWSKTADGFQATLFPVKGDGLMYSPDLTFKLGSVLPQ